MDRIVERVIFDAPPKPTLVRVAAYGRVSSGKDAMLHSLSAQVSYYSKYIQSHQGWLYVGAYMDEALTGTKANRPEFQRMLADCRAGKIDLILTKSISRFSRNTVAFLETVRELKALGVDIFFEEQNIHSSDGSGELMTTILSSFAQEESRSASENQKWRIRKNFKEGMPWNGRMLGYRYNRGTYTVIPEEAVTVRQIFHEYLSGKGCVAIANRLNKDGIPSPSDGKWGKSEIMLILRQYAYTGNLLLQRFYRNNYLEKKTLMNRGELPMYHAENCHEAIISAEEFTEVQNQIAIRAKRYHRSGSSASRYPLSGRIVCGGCGKHYRRKTTRTGPVWICSTFNFEGKAACPSKQIPEVTLLQVCKEVLNSAELTAELLDSRLTDIRAEKNNTLIFSFKDGTETVRQWHDRSRAEAWTAEKRKAASDRRKERDRNG